MSTSRYRSGSSRCSRRSMVRRNTSKVNSPSKSAAWTTATFERVRVQIRRLAVQQHGVHAVESLHIPPRSPVERFHATTRGGRGLAGLGNEIREKSVRPALGGLLVEGAVDAFESSPDRIPSRAVRQHVDDLPGSRPPSGGRHRRRRARSRRPARRPTLLDDLGGRRRGRAIVSASDSLGFVHQQVGPHDHRAQHRYPDAVRPHLPGQRLGKRDDAILRNAVRAEPDIRNRVPRTTT